MVAVTTISTRLQEKPATGSPSSRTGHPLGVDDWYLVLERLEATGALVGSFDVGDGTLVGSLGWVDITDRWRGTESFRGADEPTGRPRVGTFAVTLDNRDAELTPYVTYYNTRPGTIIRCGLVSIDDTRADGWIPMWTGVVKRWPTSYYGPRPRAAGTKWSTADSWVTVELVETVSKLATINTNALGSVVGNGETITPRINRLLTAGGWPYGLITRAGSYVDAPEFTLQSTDMALERLAECYLSADSALATFRSDVTGAALVTEYGPYVYSAGASRLAEFSIDANGSGNVRLRAQSDTASTSVHGTHYSVCFDLGSLVINNDDEHVRNRHEYARIGGTVQSFPHKVSIGLFGEFTSPRYDLKCQTDMQAMRLAQEHSDHEATTGIRVDEVTVTSTGRPAYLLPMAALDVHDAVWMQFVEHVPPSIAGTFNVRSRTDSVRPLVGKVAWTTTLALNTGTLVQWPDGTQLDPAPR